MKSILLLAVTLLGVTFSFSQNVGIGTTTPSSPLHIRSAISNNPFIIDGTAGSYYSILENGIARGYWGSYAGNPEDVDFGTYSGATGKLHLTIQAVPMLTINNAGNVGIGTTLPTEAKLQIHEPAGNTQFIAAAGSNLPGISTFVPVTSPSIGFNSRYQSGYKYMGTGHAAFFQYSPSLGQLYYYYSSTTGVADGSINSVFALAIDSNGRLGIGTSIPTAPLHVTGNVVFGSSSISPATGYKLSIDGKLICEEARVQLSGSWPDYVFNDDYKLRPLDELEKLIRVQKHLPNIPTAAQVEKEGFDLGGMNKKLLEKVEELTLYIIELNKDNKSLNERIKKLEEK